MRFATDTGGTFTDLVVEEDDGRIFMFKASTVPTEPVKGVLAAFNVAAHHFGVERKTLLERGSAFIHGTTHAINAIITKRTAKTALLVTEGHPDILVLREGGRIEPFNHEVPFPEPFIPRALTFEVPGRVLASGKIHKPIGEQAIVEIAAKLKQLGIEAVAVCLLWSVVNPEHELKVGELLAMHLPGVPVTLSHALNPSLREYRRAIASSIDASLKPLMNRYTAGLTKELRDAGFSGRILVLTSEGGMVDVAEVQNAPILAINSGPSMAPIAGARIAKAEAPGQDFIIFDTGGTTFDVSLVRDGRVPFSHETWLGRPYQSDLTGFSSVDVKSIGAGGGSLAWVDSGGVLHVGPQSAGAAPGPACYGAGGTGATVTDAALVLGYIDPEYFLGGRIVLQQDAAAEAVRRDVAVPLRMPLEKAAAAVMGVWTENMVQAIADITVNQGIDPAQAAIIAGGGAAGLNANAIAARLNCHMLIVPEVGAALSAYGAAVSDIAREYRRIFVTHTNDFDRKGASNVVAELKKLASTFAKSAGSDPADVRIEYTLEARYHHQVWEIDIAVDIDRLLGEGGAKNLEEDFHRAHEQIFAFRDPDSPVEVIAWRASVRSKTGLDTHLTLSQSGAPSRNARSRRAYFASVGWAEVPAFEFRDLAIGKEVKGPAIVESPFTSIVIEPDATFSRTESSNLVLKPKAVSASTVPRKASVKA
jgi:N-methylhydantoinase A